MIREKIAHAWLHVHRTDKKALGMTNCVSLEPYLKWVQDRAISLKMPYSRQEPLHLVDKEPTYYFMDDAEKLKIALTKVQRERDAWKNKYQVVDIENAKLQEHFKHKNEVEVAKKKRKAQEDLFSSCIQPVPDVLKSSETLSTSVAWKLVVDKLVIEKTQMEDQIRVLTRRLQGGLDILFMRSPRNFRF